MSKDAPFLELPNDQKPDNYPHSFVYGHKTPHQYDAHNMKYKMAPSADEVLKGMK